MRTFKKAAASTLLCLVLFGGNAVAQDRPRTPERGLSIRELRDRIRRVEPLAADAALPGGVREASGEALERARAALRPQVRLRADQLRAYLASGGAPAGERKRRR